MAGVVGHNHCPVCGACLINGYTLDSHKCLSTLSKDIADVMRADMGTPAQQSQHRNRTEFKAEMLAKYGFQVVSG